MIRGSHVTVMLSAAYQLFVVSEVVIVHVNLVWEADNVTHAYQDTTTLPIVAVQVW